MGLQAICLHTGAGIGGALVLPHQGVVYGLSAVAVPHHRRFPLVGDAERDQVGGRKARLGEDIPHDAMLRFPYFFRIVLYPARLGEDLGELFLGYIAQPAFFVE